ncbi:cholinephosphotransferase 1 [Sipha flava]|uniref:diacylglycerol cholinephosphotransferase n=1 Tax=Sipha flava TaxID=143950 RepID=A0A2S2QSH9_9HEMI|nr:cholinephosphotransferase 1 [Sipha flava]XP_025417165.1 cholinephosphotransferase 1 [Sipha flava]
MLFCFTKNKILLPVQLKKLSEHSYKCESRSVLDSYLQPFWNWLVLQTPIWLAPNLITLIGLLVNIITTLLIIHYSPDANSEIPRWASFLCGLGLFIYQSLDAIDGKQARRTGSSSPLGELFDHGCDSISTVFITLSTCVSVKLGEYPSWMFLQSFFAVALFYLAHWQTYVSGTLRFGRFDVTETQISIIFVHIMSAVFGTSIWDIVIPPFNIKLKFILLLMTLSISLYLAKSNLTVILTGGVGKNGSSVAGTSVLSPAIPLILVVLPAYIISCKSTENIYETHPVLYIMAFGVVTAKITNKLVIAHMTKSPIEYVDSTLIGPAMLFLNQYFNSVLPEYYVLCVCLAWTIIDLTVYSIFVCKEICDHLRVYLFYITTTMSIAKPGTSNKMSSSSSKNGSNNSSGLYQHQFKYPSTMTSFIYPSKTKTK